VLLKGAAIYAEDHDVNIPAEDQKDACCSKIPYGNLGKGDKIPQTSSPKACEQRAAPKKLILALEIFLPPN
jgi:hypothetical protein